MEENVYLIKDGTGDGTFVKESQITEDHVKYFIAQLIGNAQQLNQTSLIFFENMILKANGLEGVAGDDPDLTQYSSSEVALITEDLTRMVEIFNSCPLAARDIYTRGLLGAMGIHFNPPQEETLARPEPPTGKIIQLPR